MPVPLFVTSWSRYILFFLLPRDSRPLLLHFYASSLWASYLRSWFTSSCSRSFLPCHLFGLFSTLNFWLSFWFPLLIVRLSRSRESLDSPSAYFRLLCLAPSVRPSFPPLNILNLLSCTPLLPVFSHTSLPRALLFHYNSSLWRL